MPFLSQSRFTLKPCDPPYAHIQDQRLGTMKYSTDQAKVKRFRFDRSTAHFQDSLSNR